VIGQLTHLVLALVSWGVYPNATLPGNPDYASMPKEVDLFGDRLRSALLLGGSAEISILDQRGQPFLCGTQGRVWPEHLLQVTACQESVPSIDCLYDFAIAFLKSHHSNIPQWSFPVFGRFRRECGADISDRRYSQGLALPVRSAIPAI
jgi:hypothetical protein